MKKSRRILPTADGVNVHYGSNNVNAGPLRQIPEICVDHFHGDSLISNTFFLSHAHTDHMVGLEGKSFLNRLNEDGVVLYTHRLTPKLLKGFTKYLGGAEKQDELIARRKIIPLEIYDTRLLRMKSIQENGCYVIASVTLLSAGHCPGSVMFLFETEELRILHTGDFRKPASEFALIPNLHYSPMMIADPNNKFKKIAVPQTREQLLKPIDQLYIDTTFCTKECGDMFPDRREVIQKAIEHLKLWLTNYQSTGNWVFIKFAAKFAHEFTLIELCNKLKMKVHVKPERRAIYKSISTVYDATTEDGSNTALHFCDDRNCWDGPSLQMKLSCMWYAIHTQNNPATDPNAPGPSSRRQEIVTTRSCETVIRTDKRLSVCYSMHPSLAEAVAVIDYLKPKVVTPLVMPFLSMLHDIKIALSERCSHSFTYQDYQTPSLIINDPRERTKKGWKKSKKNLLLESKTADFYRMGVLDFRKKWPEDIDPDHDNSDSNSDSEENEKEKVEEDAPFVPTMVFDRDPILDIDKKYLFSNYNLPSSPENSPPKIQSEPRKLFLGYSSSSSSSSEENDTPQSSKRRKQCDDSNPGNDVVRKLVFDTQEQENEKEKASSSVVPVSISGQSIINNPIKTPPSNSTPAEDKKIASKTEVETITIDDEEDDDETDFEEVESNSSNSQSLLADYHGPFG